MMIPYKPVAIVVTYPAVLEAFRRRALRSKHEVFGILVGRVGAKVYVDDIVYPELDSSSPEHVLYSTELFNQIKGAIGTIHSHPDATPALSKEDMLTQAIDGEVVFAIYSFWKKDNAKRRSSSLDWYCGSPETKVIELRD
jgi:proteasome lid subunit RPN8/RPN11